MAPRPAAIALAAAACILCAAAATAAAAVAAAADRDETRFNAPVPRPPASHGAASGRPEPSMEGEDRLLSIYRLLNLSSDAGKVSSRQVCSAILDYVGNDVCNASSVTDSAPTAEVKPTALEVWGLGVLFVTLINLSSLLGVIFMPLMNKHFYKQMLMVMIGLAVGSLSGSAVFHLIPQAFGLAEADPRHRYLDTSAIMWSGIWVFFLVERVLKIISSRSRLSGLSALATKDASDSPTDGSLADHMLERYDFEASPRSSHSHGHGPQVHFQQGKDSVVATVAWMVVFGDGFHNFIDGLSIGAAFGESALTGISISVAVLCEELPHELGDFAVLLAAGMTVRQALVYNLLSACTCYGGLVLGVLLGEFQASTYVFGFAAGMFMYIALVDMMPELTAAAEDAGVRGWRAAGEALCLQNVGLLAGAAALFCLARFQDCIRFW